MIRYALFFVTAVLWNGVLLYAQPEPVYRCHHAEHYTVPPLPLSPAAQARIKASVERSDTFDILHHDINLDIIDFLGQTISGYCRVQFASKKNNITQLPLDLLAFTVDSVLDAGGNPLNFQHYDSVLLVIDLPAPLSNGDVSEVWVYYGGRPQADASWGGFKFDAGYAYNLGIGLTSSPYNMGRSWFPCFDNFVERATYEFHIRTQGNNRAYCIGSFLGETQIGADTFVRHYEMNQQLPTYLVNVAVTDYTDINWTHTGQYGPVPVQLVARPSDTTLVRNTFARLGDAIDAFEKWYGAYWWERVGYVMTPQGAMEHPTNIAYPRNVGVGGATASHNRLMAHELAHCWWGNVVTLKTPNNMWIKEGNAEYGAHLFTEHVLGEQAFRNEVKSNLRLVLRQAHFDDFGYHPLSGIPTEHAYGTHTYRKGASMLHNMRGYMGDSLFFVGQNAVLNAYSYQAIDAYEYRDALAQATGLDMNPYFDAWIFGTGFAGYEVNSMNCALGVGGQYDAVLEIEQKLRGTATYHQQTPLEITLVGDGFQKYTALAEVSGPLSTVHIMGCPFLPNFAIINERNALNIALLAEERLLTQPSSDQTLTFADLSVGVVSISDTARLWAEHYWIAPDPSPEPTARLSGTHYWRIEGDIQGSLHARVRLDYNANAIPRLDQDLLSVTEDSLILVYRRNPGQPWRRYPHYSKNILFNATDGQGFIRIDSLSLGEYAFANGDLPLWSSTEAIQDPSRLSVLAYPNPASQTLYLSATNINEPEWRLELSDAAGRRLASFRESIDGGDLQAAIDVSMLAPGCYFLTVYTPGGERLYQEQILIGGR